MDEQIRSRLEDTRRALFEHFDEDVHERLRMRLADARAQLDRVGRRFWSLTRHVLADQARFDDIAFTFDLVSPPRKDIPAGRYHLISRVHPQAEGAGQFLYRLSHPLGEHVLAQARDADTPAAEILFDISRHPTRIAVVEALRGQRGYLTLTRLSSPTNGRSTCCSGFYGRRALLDGNHGEAVPVRRPRRRHRNDP